MCAVWDIDRYKITFKLVINSRIISRGPAFKKHWSKAWVCGRGHGCLSVVRVVCCQVEVSTTD